MERCIPAGVSKESSRVAFVDEYQRIVFVGEITDLRQGSHVAIHWENAIGDDEFETTFGGFQFLFKICKNIEMKRNKDESYCFAIQPTIGVSDAGITYRLNHDACTVVSLLCIV